MKLYRFKENGSIAVTTNYELSPEELEANGIEEVGEDERAEVLKGLGLEGLADE